MDAFKKYEEYVKSFDDVSPDREKVLSVAINGPEGIDRDRAIAELVNANMRRVLSLTQRYRSYPDYMDIVFDGNLGLIKAASDFDAGKGRFSTHSTQRIKTAIRDGMRSRLGAISIARPVATLARKIKDMVSSSEKSDHELAVELDVEPRDVIAARLAMLAMLDGIPIVDEDGDTIDVPDPRSLELFDNMQRKDMLAIVQKAADDIGLTKDEVTLVSEARGTGEAKMAKAMADRFGLTPSRMRMLRIKLVWDIRRRILTNIGMKEYLFLSAVGRLPARSYKEETVG